MNMWVTLNQDLIEQERWQRDHEIAAIYKQRQVLELIGYRSPGARLRSAAAGWLLRLAVRLDGQVATLRPA